MKTIWVNKNLPAGMPVTDENGKVIGVTNSDGTISLTDADFIGNVLLKEIPLLSAGFSVNKKEKGGNEIGN